MHDHSPSSSNIDLSSDAATGATLMDELVYVSDDVPGITRKKSGNEFEYFYPDGSPVKVEELSRIAALAIPPAYENVWICLDPRGHLQATGRDARGRKQY